MGKYIDDMSSNQPVHPRKGKGTFLPGKPKKKAYQHPIDESSPAIKVPKKLVYKQQGKD